MLGLLLAPYLWWCGAGWCFGCVFFLTVVRCPGDQRRYEEPESISEYSSVVIMLLLPELSWHRRQVNTSHCRGRWQCINRQNTLRNNKSFATLPLNSEEVMLAWWMATVPSHILRHSTAPNSLAEDLSSAGGGRVQQAVRQCWLLQL